MDLLYTNLVHELERHAFDIRRTNSDVYGGSTIARKREGTVVFRQLNDMDYILTLKDVHDPELLQVTARVTHLFYYGIRISKIDNEYYGFVFSSDLGCSCLTEQDPTINDFILFCTVDNRMKNPFSYFRFLGDWVRDRCISKSSFSACVKLKTEDVKAMFKQMKRELLKKPKFNPLVPAVEKNGTRLVRVNNQWALEH